MKKLIQMAIIVVFCALTTSVAVAQEQCIRFNLQAGDVIQREIPFDLSQSYWYGMKVYEFERSYSFPKQVGYWNEVQPGELRYSGMYRFVAQENAGVSICNDATEFSGYIELMDQRDVYMFLKGRWNPADIGLPYRNGITGSYDYSYWRVALGSGTSVKLSQIHSLGDQGGLPVAVITFSDEGFPEKVYMYDDPAIRKMWLHQTQPAILIDYQGNDWTADRAAFISKINKVNLLLSRPTSRTRG